VLVPINTCPLTANLAVPKFVVGGEVLMDNTPDNIVEKDVRTKTVTLQVCEFKLLEVSWSIVWVCTFIGY